LGSCCHAFFLDKSAIFVGQSESYAKRQGEAKGRGFLMP
jgi:hypothetical protein